MPKSKAQTVGILGVKKRKRWQMRPFGRFSEAYSSDDESDEDYVPDDYDDDYAQKKPNGERSRRGNLSNSVVPHRGITSPAPTNFISKSDYNNTRFLIFLINWLHCSYDISRETSTSFRPYIWPKGTIWFSQQFSYVKYFSVDSLKNPGTKMVNSCLELHLMIIASPFHTLLSLSIQNEIYHHMKILSNR